MDAAGRHRSSRVDPVEEGRRLVDGLGLDPKDTVVVLGLAPFYQFLQLSERLEEYSRQVVCVEADEDLRREGEVLWNQLGSPVPFPELLSPKEGGKLLNLFGRWNVSPRNLKILRGPGGQEPGYDAILSHVKDYVGDRLKGETTEAAFARRWLRNAERNRGLEPLRLLSEAPGKRGEAILVSSGPALARNLDGLKAVAGKTPIYALPGPASFLGRHGIPVQGIVTTDGGYWNLAHFESVVRHYPDATLYVPFSVYGAIPNRFKNRYFFFDDEAFATRWPDPSAVSENWIPQCGTAVNAALMVLKRLGHEAVRTVGIGFSLTPWSCHAPGNITEERFFSEASRLRPFETAYHRAFSMKLMPHPEAPGMWADEKLDLYRRLFQEQVARMDIPVHPLFS